jgi:hypothetical protein
MQRTLLTFTGGIETTYIAWKLLSETQDEVTGIYLYLPVRENVRLFDGDINHFNKVKPLINELNKIRPFNVIVKKCSPSELTEELNHYYTYFINFAAPLLNNNIYDRIATGRTWEQAGQKILSDPNLNGSPSAIAGQRLFDKLVNRGSLWNPLVTHDYHQNFTKAHALLELPEHILSKTFSCIAPLADSSGDLHACGSCYKCLWIKTIKQKLSEGMTPEQIDAWRIEKSYEYGGDIMAPIRYWLYLELGVPLPAHINQPNFSNKQQLIDFVQTNPHYSLKNHINVGIWGGLT